MYSLIFHGRRSLELHKWRHLGVSVHNSFSFRNDFSSVCARDGQKGQIFTFSYLIDSLSLTPKLAESISRKVSFENRGNPNSVLSLLRSYGFTESQISTMITDYPRLLVVDANKSLGPKLRFLKSIKGSELTETVSKVPKMLGMKGNESISRYYDFVEEVIKADKVSKLEKLCDSMPKRMQEKKIRNVSVLRELGVPLRLLLPLFISDRKLVCGKGKFEESVKKVVEMGFDPNSAKFVEALRAVQGLSDYAIEKKVDIYKRLGFAVGDVWEMFRKCPSLLRHSEKKITQKFNSLKETGLLKHEIIAVVKKSPECIAASAKKMASSIETFLGLGFSKDEVARMVKRFPRCLTLSAEMVKKKTKFLVKKKNKIRLQKMIWTRKAVVSYPQVLGHSMKKRIVPRCNVMKALMSKGLVKHKRSKLPSRESVLLCTDEEFLNMYVRMHDDKEIVTELMDLFTGDQKTC